MIWRKLGVGRAVQQKIKLPSPNILLNIIPVIKNCISDLKIFEYFPEKKHGTAPFIEASSPQLHWKGHRRGHFLEFFRFFKTNFRDILEQLFS